MNVSNDQSKTPLDETTALNEQKNANLLINHSAKTGRESTAEGKSRTTHRNPVRFTGKREGPRERHRCKLPLIGVLSLQRVRCHQKVKLRYESLEEADQMQNTHR